jgi:uncharacterized protein (DUF2249 family)
MERKMQLYPENATKIEVEGATVPFVKFKDNDITIYQFDSSKCGHPEPMINAMSGLQLIKNNEQLEMINSKAPLGLFPKIEADFNYVVEELSDGRFKISFTRKNNNSELTTDFNDNKCDGGGACS